MTALKFTVLGTRGSVPVEGKNFSRYGGATSCYKILAGKEEIYLDVGSGIVSALPARETNITILLTHMHLDHLIGLPFFIALTEKDRPIEIYSNKRSGLMPKEAIDRLISNPFWPCKIENYPAKVSFHLLPTKFFIGDIEVDTLEGSHPEGSTIYKLTRRGTLNIILRLARHWRLLPKVATCYFTTRNIRRRNIIVIAATVIRFRKRA